MDDRISFNFRDVRVEIEVSNESGKTEELYEFIIIKNNEEVKRFFLVNDSMEKAR